MTPRSDELLRSAHERLEGAARAALSEHDLNARSHRGLWHLLHERVVAEGEIPDDLVRPIQKAQELRVAVDYDAQRVSEDEARELLAAAKRLVDAVSEAYGGR